MGNCVIVPICVAVSRAIIVFAPLRGLSGRGKVVNDCDLVAEINRLAKEEHALERVHAASGLSPEEAARLRVIEVQLDLAWDLLRQRRALRHAGRDPNQATVRQVDTVEGYRQ
jgi:membrane-bound ClpP family serine protease